MLAEVGRPKPATNRLLGIILRQMRRIFLSQTGKGGRDGSQYRP